VLAFGLVALPVTAEEPLEGKWQLTITQVSQNCGPGDPPPPSVLDVEIQQSDSFVVLLPEDPEPDLSEMVGTVSGQSMSLGFEVFENPTGITVYDSASNSLTISQDFKSFSGDLPWDFYSGVDCGGVDNWSAVRLGAAPEPNSLTGTWQVTISFLSENCGDGLDPPVVLVLDAVQFGDGAVRIESPPVPGVREVAGTVAGQSLRVGFEIHEASGVTIYDSASNNLVIAQDFNSFSGDLPWNFYEPLVCTGVDHAVPEPNPALLGLFALATLIVCRRRRGRSTRNRLLHLRALVEDGQEVVAG
jgi:hypothetical protein